MLAFSRFSRQRLQQSCSSLFSTSANGGGSIGFIGLGQMGGPMARNLLKAGQSVTVCDVVPANVKNLASAGAKVAETPQQVASQCRTVITMLPSTEIVEHVYFDKNGLYEQITRDHLLMDSSTIDAVFTKQLAKQVDAKHACFVDAPVSGGVKGAQNATLTFMVGGSKKSFDKAKPVLQMMGQNIVHCGDSSTGQIAKICNNLALGVQMVGIAEAMNLGSKLGIDPKILASVMNTSTSGCWSSKVNNPFPGVLEGVPASHNYDGGFASKLLRKDLTLAMDAAKMTETSMPLTALTQQLYNVIVAQGNGHKDFSVVLRFLQGGK